MAGEWIKWVKGLVRKREIILVANKLKVDRRIVASSCMLFWEWADDETTDGHLGGVAAGDIDAIADLPGLAASLVEIGWLRITAQGTTIVNWERNNGESAKSRGMAQRRQGRKRSADIAPDPCHAPVTEMSRSQRDKGVTREEKRREERSSSRSNLRLEDPAPTEPADAGAAAPAAGIEHLIRGTGITDPTAGELIRGGLSEQAVREEIDRWKPTGKPPGVLVNALRNRISQAKTNRRIDGRVAWFMALPAEQQAVLLGQFCAAMGPRWAHVPDERLVQASQFKLWLLDHPEKNAA